jgi:hypothetical protein
MKTQKHFVVVVAAVIAASMLVPTVFAQTGRLRVEIPFDFYMNDEPMPAGTYVVSTLHDGKIIELRSAKGRETVFAMAEPAHNRISTASRLVFHRYGDENFLAELHWAGRDSGQQVRATKLELEARNRTAPSRVAVVPR